MVLAECAPHRFPESGFVLRYEDGLFAALDIFHGRRRGCRRRDSLIGGRKKNFERGAAPDLALDFDPAVELFDRCINRSQSQASAFAGFFGGKKWLKNPMDDARFHPATVVRNG